jgi:hypothetical protein
MNTKDLKASKKLLKKYSNGDSIPRKEIAEALGCHEQTIYNHFKNSGIKKCPFAGSRLTNYPNEYLDNLIKQLEREKKLSGNKKLKPVKKNPTKRELKANGAGGRLTVEDLAKATSMKAANIRVRFKEFCNSYADNIDSLCITYRKKHYYVSNFLDYLKAYPKPNPNYKVDKKVENNKNISDRLYEVMRNLKASEAERKPVFILGYGASGSGKTSSLPVLKRYVVFPFKDLPIGFDVEMRSLKRSKNVLSTPLMAYQ